MVKGKANERIKQNKIQIKHLDDETKSKWIMWHSVNTCQKEKGKKRSEERGSLV